jgi:hypothetical protein
MRRLLPLVLAAVVVLPGCGTERPDTPPRADASFSPAPTPTATPTLAPRPTPAADLHRPLADFPLAIGLPGENEDDHSPVVVTGEPATHAFSECGHRVWDPQEGTTDVIGVDWSAEAEWSRGRTLVLFASTEAARAAVDRAQDVITNCPRDDGDDHGWTEHTGIDYYTGDSSYGWIDRYWTAELGGFDTGLTIYHVAQVGRAVLLTYEYDEGNGDQQTLLAAFAHAAEEDQPVVDRMAELREARAGIALTITPSGVGPFELGMDDAQLRRAAADVGVREHTSCGATLSWTSPEGVEVSGGVNTDDGLAYVSARGSGAATTDGIAIGDSLADLYRVYPLLEADGTGSSDAFVSDQGAADYVFSLDASAELAKASDRHVVQIMVIADDQHCAG